MQQVLLVIHLLVAIMLIGLVMLQKSEGGALGIGGGSGNLFSSRGVGNTLTRATAILAACFFATSVALTMVANHRSSGSLTDQASSSSTQEAPAQPGGTDNKDSGSSLLPKLDTNKPAVPTN